MTRAINSSQPFLESDYKGKAVEDAQKIAITNGYDRTRIVRKGDTDYVLTCDFDIHRVNFEITEDGIVTRAFTG